MLNKHKIGSNQRCTPMHNKDHFTNLVFFILLLFLGCVEISFVRN